MALTLTFTGITGILILTLKLTTLLSASSKHICTKQERGSKMLQINNQTFKHDYNLTHNYTENYEYNHQNEVHKDPTNYTHNHYHLRKHAYKHNHAKNHTSNYTYNQTYSYIQRHTQSTTYLSKQTGETTLEMDHSISRRKRRGSKRAINLHPHLTGLAVNSRKITKQRASCVLEGHLTSKDNWFGYIANVTMRVSASMHFEMTYPAKRCCQNVLFYLADEAVMVQAAMDCHQREMLLSPRNERMLKLSERTPWAGCQVSRNREGRDMMMCRGSRSFSQNFSSGSSLMTWYVAVSDCLSTTGLDLFYRLNIVGNVGDCHDISNNRHNNHHKPKPNSNNNLRNNPVVRVNNPSNKNMEKHALEGNNLHDPLIYDDNDQFNIPYSENFIPPYFSTVPTQKTIHTPRQVSDKRFSPEGSIYCEYTGNVNSSHNWYGFMKNVSIEKGGVMKYYFTQPASMQTQNVILYRKEDVVMLDWEMSCWEKEGLISAMMMKYQILDMNYRATWAGCRLVESGPHKNVTCTGVKRFGSPQKVHLSLSNCRSHKGVLLHYRLQVYGHKGACSASFAMIQDPFVALVLVLVCLLCLRTKLYSTADSFPLFSSVSYY